MTTAVDLAEKMAEKTDDSLVAEMAVKMVDLSIHEMDVKTVAMWVVM